MKNTAHKFTPEQLERFAKFAVLVETIFEDARVNGTKPLPTGKEFANGLNLVADLYLGGEATEKRAHQVGELLECLVYDFSEFYEKFLEVAGSDSPTRKQVEELWRSGRITSKTTFAELAEIVAVMGKDEAAF